MWTIALTFACSITMTNQVRAEVRRITSELQQLRDTLPPHGFEWDSLNAALVFIVRADVHDFHIGAKKSWKSPKKRFTFKPCDNGK